MSASDHPPPAPPVDRREIRVVAITGGTHGNESTSVALARHLLRHPQLAERSSFETKVLFVNVAAVERNVRYVDEDLNRCFFLKDLADDNSDRRDSLEAVRAREINDLLGPKGSSDPGADLIIDLHNTTANTGVALMMPPNDELSHAIGFHLMRTRDAGKKKDDDDASPSSSSLPVRIVDYTSGKDDYPMLPTIARHGMTFEVGAVPCGCIDGALFHQSLDLILSALDYVHAHNLALRASSRDSSSSSGGKDASVSLWQEVDVPVYRSVRAVDYPRYDDGEGEGGKSTPSFPGPHGAIAAAIHPAIRGKDFVVLRRGDPVFLTMEGETVGFEAESDSTYYPFFIDEASYYEKGIAFMISQCCSRRFQVLVSI